MHFAASTLEPGDAAADVPPDIFIDAERGLFALIEGSAHAMSPALASAVARRSIEAFLRSNRGPASPAQLHALVEHVARAVRQAGELVDKLGWSATLEASTGKDFVPDSTHHGNAFGCEAAFVWMKDRHAFIAAIGRAAVLRGRGGALEPLHRLHVLAEEDPGNALPRELAFQIVTSALSIHPLKPLGSLHELDLAVAPGDRVALVSPAVAVPFFATPRQPPTRIVASEPKTIADWLVTLAPAQPAGLHKSSAIVIAV
jgi:hypothetical protein